MADRLAGRMHQFDDILDEIESREAGPLSDGPAHSDRAHSAATDSRSHRAIRPESTTPSQAKR